MSTLSTTIQSPRGDVTVPNPVLLGFARAYDRVVTGAHYDARGRNPRADGVIDAFCLAFGFDPDDDEQRDEAEMYLDGLASDLSDDDFDEG